MTLDATIRAVQEKLGVTVDGNPGPQTWNVIYRSIVGEPPVSSGTGTLADERSERNIATLLSEVRPLARALIESAGLFCFLLHLSSPVAKRMPGCYPARRPLVFGLSSCLLRDRRLPDLLLLQGSNILTKNVQQLQLKFILC